ncbi:MAG TPA: hypothetical protein PL151_11720 [Phycisphaerae bacterium]|nr:hypothetical protein [Phycisphaerae bacterium]HOJ74209.1 hypothetical protein [Phycisphaerae bacterium]HOM51287.1 hypothetical protein [Phycisphaerae bacterium]HON65840.1 hypothetical protein [Phycisphaerae bacterium]HOQ84899.1 hypothetical protein [Phycisphaerae bacterium]
MKMRKAAVLTCGLAVAVCATLPAATLAQATVQPFPRNNVRGSALAARRPGIWVQSGIATHVQRTDAALNAFGGITITQVGPEPTIRDAVLPALVEVFLGAVDQLSLIIQTLIRGGTLPTTGT